jgi:hypothetical protein
MRVRLSRGEQRRRRQRGEHLIDDLLFGPALRRAEVGDCLILINPADNLLAHVFVRKPHTMAGLVPDHPKELRIGGVHCETIEVHGRLAGGYLENVGAQV